MMRDPVVPLFGVCRHWTPVVAVLAMLLAAAPLLAAQPSPPLADQLDAFPTSIRYSGEARAADGTPLAGRFAVEVSFFDKSGEGQLWQERFDGVDIAGGHFAVDLGHGKRVGSWPLASPQAMFASNYQLELDVSIGGTRFGPRVGLLPAGHSLESRLIIDGLRRPNDGQQHWIGYAHRSDVSSFQATVLTPSAAGQRRPQDGPSLRGPYLLSMQGPWLSRPVRELPLAVNDPLPPGTGEEGERPAVDAEQSDAPAKEINPPRHESLVDAHGRRFGTVASKVVDQLALFSQLHVPQQSTPATTVNFEGVPNIDGFYPPDTEITVGPNHVLEVTNVYFEIFDKTGGVVNAAVHTNQLWSTMPPGAPCRTNNDGDAIFMYDWQADRWVLAQFALPSGNEQVCFAVSTTGDPTGTYYLYSLVTQRFPDYFKLGVWPDPADNAYFMGTNSGFQGQYDVYAIDREHLLAGTTPRTAQFFQNMPNLQLPADTDGVTGPPAGAPGVFYSFRDGGEPYFGSPPTDSLDLREFHVDWTTPGNSTFNLVQSLTPADGLADFNWTICGFFISDCLPQPGGTGVTLDSGSWWPMQRLAYRNFGAHQSLIGTWTVDTLPSPGNHAAPRWFELRRGTETTGNWSIYQQGTQSPDNDNRWMPSIAMDGSGDIALGYSAMNSATNLFASIRYATRLTGDTPGTLQAEADMQVGSGAQTGPAHRWGDYSDMEVDPADDCTFWYVNEYLTTNGGAPWQTRIASFRIPECGAPDFDLGVTPATAIVCSGNNADYTLQASYFGGLTSDIDLSASGNPAGTSVGFTTNPITTGSLSSTMTISNITAADAGSNIITVTGSANAGSILHSHDVTLFVDEPGAPTLIAPADGSTPSTTQPFFQWSAVTGATGYTIEIASDAAFTTIVDSASVAAPSYTPVVALNIGTDYWWRVRATNTCGTGPDSTSFTFHTPVIYCVDAGLAIPDNNPTGVNSTLNIVSSLSIDDINVYINATHTYVGDLRFTLQKGGPAVAIFDRPGVPASTFGCSADDVDAFLDDEGGDGPVEDACPLNTGLSYTPNNPLSAFDGQSMGGTWTMNASDLAGADTGTLVQWCLIPTFGMAKDGFESGDLTAWSAASP